MIGSVDSLSLMSLSARRPITHSWLGRRRLEVRHAPGEQVHQHLPGLRKQAHESAQSGVKRATSVEWQEGTSVVTPGLPRNSSSSQSTLSSKRLAGQSKGEQS